MLWHHCTPAINALLHVFTSLNCSFILFSISQVVGLSVTSGSDQMVVLHTATQDDFLVHLQRGQLNPNQDRIGELVGAITDHFTR